MSRPSFPAMWRSGWGKIWRNSDRVLMIKMIYLIVGGILGTAARYLLSGATYRIFGIAFPYGTLVVNLSGCFFIGFLVTLAEKKFLLDMNLRILLMAGFCGAFTTFSTFMMETDNLIKDGETIKAVLNVAASVIIGFVLYRIGAFLGEVI